MPQQNSRSGVIDALTHTARLFGEPAAETILCENRFKHAYEVEAVQRAASRDGAICDLGGGVGVNLLALRLLGHQGRLVLIDRFDEYGERNRMGRWDDVADTLERHGIEIVRQNFWEHHELPLDTASMDVATCFDVVEHLPGHPLRQLGELHRVLRPGGTCIISGPNGASLAKRLRAIAGEYPYAPFEAWLSDHYYEHYREYVRREYEELLRRSGFDGVRSRPSADVAVCRAAVGFHGRRLHALSPRRAALWGVAAIETVVPGLRHTVYAWGRRARTD